MIVAVLLAACGAAPTPTPTLTPVPSSTPTTPPTATPEPSPTPAPEITEEATAEAEETLLLGEGAPPPFEITLPDGWQIAMQNALFIPDVDATARPVQVTVYEGPVSEGTGTIVVMWGFPNFMVGSPFALPGTPTPAPNLWSDGLRLFRTAMVEQGCNAGTDLERTYNIGDRTGSGTKFAIVDCPETPDTRGWFVGLQEDGLNFVFFVYAEPIEAMDTSEDALQGILDSIEFHVSESFPAD
ncbi:MAG: hypothetical protein CL610_24275 [Anaerolineaceae bacterium]|nr:hypothetical protein [Anaerolineaceae bacterium]